MRREKQRAVRAGQAGGVVTVATHTQSRSPSRRHAPTSHTPAQYLIWICYGPGGPGATRARTANVYGDNCAGLGDRMRGIQYLTRVAAGAKVRAQVLEAHKGARPQVYVDITAGSALA